jgi:hypothetical protein
MLKNFFSERFELCWVKSLNVSDCTESDNQICDTSAQSKQMSLEHRRYDLSLANDKL